ncbi:MAG: hypothetical protein NFCOHLIN_02351 [Gammaproteobacteria bacterium]|nr:hypothetical protein [Gammaproteobacteria bacterium]
MNLLHRQRGLSLWELLFYGVLIGVSALVVIKLLPLYMEKFKVEKAMQSIATQPDIRTLEESDMKNRLLRHFEIEDVDKFSRQEDLKKIFTVTKNKDNEGRTMSMKYEIRAPFLGALDVVLKVDKQIAIPAYSP